MASTSLRSSSVTLENIDDYLAPSQACINPAFQPTTKLGGDDNGGDATGKAITGTEPASSTNVVVPRRRRRIVRKRIMSSTDRTELPERTTTTGLGTEPISPLQQSIPKQVEGEKKTKKAVKASMADCLACSGCVTTAETVMMEERHSLKSLRNRLLSSSSGGRERPRIVTISPNSWADMCRHWNLEYKFESYDDDEARGKDDCDHHNFYFSRFTTLLWKMLSVKVVMDGNIPLQWTWIDEAQEFCQAYKKTLDTSSVEGNLQRASSNPPPLPSIAIDSSKTLYYKSDGTSEIRNNSKRPAAILPLISGSCPALVCLVEKTLTQLVPNLSQSISPMSLAGIILNHDGDSDENDKLSSHTVDTNSVLSTDDETSNIVRNKWDHWAIMPCHDKKLEASRKDFANESKEQAVDLVISTQECVELVEEWIQSQQHKNHDQSQAHLGLISTLSVANHLATLPPSTVNTDVLEPKDLLEKTSPYCVSEESPPLLLTTPTIIRECVSTKAATTTAKLQNHQMAFSSGGHANFMFMYAAKNLFGYTFDDSDGDDDGDDHGTGRGVKWQAASLAAKNVRSARLGKLLKQHYYETKLYRYQDGSYGITPVVSENEESSKLVLHFAIAHGMQTMQRALKQVVERPIGNTGNVCIPRTLHYLEAMACPHGCVNGGGSVRSTSSFSTNQKSSTSVNLARETPSETRERVRSTLGHLKVPNLAKFNTIKIPIESREIGPLPRTEYHVVPPMNYTTGAVAGESVDNMIW